MRTVTTTRLHDRHTHLSLYAALEGCPSLAGLDEAGALALLRALPSDRLSTVLGWRSGQLSLPEAALGRLPPALLVSASLHGLLLTPAAAALLRATDPELVERHAEPAWAEKNLFRLLARHAGAAGLDADRLDAFLASLEALGVGAAEDLALTSAEALRLLRASRFGPRLRLWATPELYRDLPSEAQAGVFGLKLFLDGALGARTAALSAPYRGGGRGLLIHSEAELREALLAAGAHRKPLALHALGDLAIELGLVVLGGLEREGVRLPEVRLEHVQFIAEEQARRARDLGLTLSMQPNFNADSRDYADRLDPPWLERNDPFRMLIDKVGFRPGVDLIFGSDGMPHGLEHAAQWSLFPAWPGQRLTLPELLDGYGARLDPDGPVALEIDDDARRVRLLRG